MNTNINLILPQDKEFFEQQKKIRTVNIIAIGFPIIVGFVSLIIFLITQSINPVSIKKQQEEVINEIAKFQDKKIKLFIINNRLDNIEGLLKNRRDLAENISTLLSKIPSTVTIRNLKIDNKEIILTVSSTTLGAIDELINNLIGMAEKKEIIRSVSLDTLTFGEDGNNYLVSLKSDI